MVSGHHVGVPQRGSNMAWIIFSDTFCLTTRVRNIAHPRNFGTLFTYNSSAIFQFIIWLAPRAGKMTQIARCDWLPERARWSHLARPDYPLYPASKIHQKLYNKSFIDQVCSVKEAGYWPRSFIASLWTSTSSRSINTQKKNLANIKQSWPHTWWIAHTYWLNLLNGERCLKLAW